MSSRETFVRETVLYGLLAAAILVAVLFLWMVLREDIRRLHDHGDARSRQMLDKISEVFCRVDNVHSIVNAVPAGRFTLLVVGKIVDGSPFAWGVTGTIARGEEKQVNVPFEFQIMKGAVVLCLGEAELSGITCGYHEQVPWLHGGAPICFIQKDVNMGERIVARVRSTKG